MEEKTSDKEISPFQVESYVFSDLKKPIPAINKPINPVKFNIIHHAVKLNAFGRMSFQGGMMTQFNNRF